MKNECKKTFFKAENFFSYQKSLFSLFPGGLKVLTITLFFNFRKVQSCLISVFRANRGKLDRTKIRKYNCAHMTHKSVNKFCAFFYFQKFLYGWFSWKLENCYMISRYTHSRLGYYIKFCVIKKISNKYSN